MQARDRKGRWSGTRSKKKTGGVLLLKFSLHHWRGIHIKHRSRFFFSAELVKSLFFLALFFHTATRGCLSLRGLTAASRTHCYIYLKACQVFALILAYQREGMWMGSRDKNTGLFANWWREINMEWNSEKVGNKVKTPPQNNAFVLPCCLFLFTWEYFIILSWNQPYLV